jgi:hypothetical protein
MNARDFVKLTLSALLGFLLYAVLWYGILDQSPKGGFIAAGIIFVATIVGARLYARRRRDRDRSR